MELTMDILLYSLIALYKVVKTSCYEDQSKPKSLPPHGSVTRFKILENSCKEWELLQCS